MFLDQGGGGNEQVEQRPLTKEEERSGHFIAAWTPKFPHHAEAQHFQRIAVCQRGEMP